MDALPVIVGVDDSAAARSAVLWAAAEAELSGSSLLIVHAPVAAPGLGARNADAVLRAADDVGGALLESSAAVARAQHPELDVRVMLSHADPPQALIDVSIQARLVVLGSATPPYGEISLLGSKRMRVTAHAHCPVLLVGRISAFSPPNRVSRVVVGASDTHAGRAAFRFAADEAARRGVSLHLVSVRSHDAVRPSVAVLQAAGGAGTSSAPPRSTSPGRHPEMVHSALDSERNRVRGRYPELVILEDLVVGEADEVLPSYSDGSTIVVVGCRHSDDLWSTRVGPVATSVIHRSRGPVVVVGAVPRGEWDV